MQISPLRSSSRQIFSTLSSTVSRSECTMTSGSSGGSYGSEMPVKFPTSPASARL